MNRMEQATARLLERQIVTSGEIVSYNGQSIHVVIAHSDHDQVEPRNNEIAANVQDFIIPFAEYDQDPKPGDRITRADGSIYAVADTEERYQFDNNCWRWSDPYHVMRRVHTNQVFA